jgi:hypothetical protein
MNLYIRTQSDILSDIEDDVRDDANKRWKKTEIYRALNRSIRRMGTPYLPVAASVTFSSSNTANLPAGVRGPLTVEYSDNNDDLWYPVGMYDIAHDADNNLVLSLPHVPGYSVRVRWHAEQTPVPAVSTLPGLTSGIGSSNTSLTVSSSVSVAPVGFVKINDEWIQYTGMSSSGSQTLLTGLDRGVHGTTAASHTASDTIEWGVVAVTQATYEYLRMQTLAYLFGQLIAPVRSAESDNYQWLMQWYQAQADEQRKLALWMPTTSSHLSNAYSNAALDGGRGGLRGDGVYY